MGSSAKFRIPDPIGASVIPDGASARREWNQRALTEKRTAVLLADERQLEQTIAHLRGQLDAHLIKGRTGDAITVQGVLAHAEARLARTRQQLGRSA